MLEVSAVIVNSRGLHARPAAQLVRLVSRYNSDVHVLRGKRRANAKSVASLLMLAAGEGTELTIQVEGDDEDEVATTLLEFIAAGFSDDSVANNPQQPQAQPGTVNRRPKRMTHKVSGIGITASFVIGQAHRHVSGSTDVPRYRLAKNTFKAEIERYENAVEQVRQELSILREEISTLPGAAEIAPFVDLYSMLLDDAEFSKKPQSLIRRRQINAEWALKERVDIVSASFNRIADSYLRERGRDIEHVMNRLLAAMKVTHQQQKITATTGENCILIAADLDPADVIHVQQFGYLGFITESGGGTSHTAILARSMGIPALIGARGVLSCLHHQEQVLLDAEAEIAIINPDAETLARYKKRREKKKSVGRRRQARGGQGVRCRDGEVVFLHTNIDLPEEMRLALQVAADGVGLFRTEFLFMHRTDLPSEDEQFEIYRHVLSVMSPLPVVIRTLDIGGDKLSAAAPSVGKVANPALGVRAIRYCLAMPELFLSQLRALLRAGAEYNNLRILLPMLSHPVELDRTIRLLNNAHEQLRVTKHINQALPPIGGMIEVPAAVFVMQALAKSLDFFSIGTNDLIQYTMAIDRNDETLAPLCDPLHPAILQLLSMIVNNARRVNRPVTLCGEMAGDARLTRLILALGLRHLSMNTTSLEGLREVLAGIDCSALQGGMRAILKAPDPDSARLLLDKLNDI